MRYPTMGRQRIETICFSDSLWWDCVLTVHAQDKKKILGCSFLNFKKQIDWWWGILIGLYACPREALIYYSETQLTNR